MSLDYILIFLTGCINPAGMSLTQLQDKETRKNQYIDTIKYYLQHTEYKVLFVENSNIDISSFLSAELLTDRLEILTFEGNNYNKELGKGYGEMKIIDYAFKHSSFLNKAEFIFKITGRLKLLNFATYLSKFENNSDIEIFVDLRQDLKVADSRFYGATPQFYKNHFLKYQELVNDGKAYFFEHALCYASLEIIQCRKNLLLFSTLPKFEGVSGTDGTSYKKPFYKWFLRNLLYKFRYISLRYT